MFVTVIKHTLTTLDNDVCKYTNTWYMTRVLEQWCSRAAVVNNQLHRNDKPGDAFIANAI